MQGNSCTYKMEAREKTDIRRAPVILVTGLPGSGKTMLARELARSLNLVHLSSDAIRTTLQKRGRYDESNKELVYREMWTKAREVLDNNGKVVLDATFHKASRRKAFETLAREMHTRPVVIQVKAGEEETRRRLQHKRPDSEADWQVYLLLKNEYEEPEIIDYVVHTDEGKAAGELVEELLRT